VGEASGPAVAPRLLAAVAPMAAPPGPLGAETTDLWHHEAVGPGAVSTVVQLPGRATKLVLVVRDAVVVYVGLGRLPGSGAGQYDLVHPGAGMLAFVVPPTLQVGLVSASPLSDPADLYALAGWYAAQP
jgi:hypothetical protein